MVLGRCECDKFSPKNRMSIFHNNIAANYFLVEKNGGGAGTVLK
jgi:hypothetical protein